MRKLFLGLYFLAIFTFFIYPMDSDGDFFQHANIGRYVLENKSLPHFDTLTFTAQGKEYIGYSWATGIIFYSLYETFGPIAINLFMASITLITFSLFYPLALLEQYFPKRNPWNFAVILSKKSERKGID